jgi:hypothetical protein
VSSLKFHRDVEAGLQWRMKPSKLKGSSSVFTLSGAVVALNFTLSGAVVALNFKTLKFLQFYSCVKEEVPDHCQPSWPKSTGQQPETAAPNFRVTERGPAVLRVPDPQQAR